MKFGMNLLLWTAGVTEEHYPLLARLKEIGFDGVELPLFEVDDAALKRTARELDNLGLGRTAVTVCTPETNPIDPDPKIRQAALDFLKQRIDGCATVGAEVLCGPFHSALGALKGRGRTDEEWTWCVDVQRADRQANIQSTITTQVDASKSSATGVSIDEEMTNMMSAQHAYQAAARFLSTVDETLDTLINMVR